MSFSAKYNRGKKFDIDTTGFQYDNPADLYKAYGEEKVFPLTAIFINDKSKFGDYPVFATDKNFVNAPSHMLDIANEILSNTDDIQAINDGKVGFSIYEYTSEKYNKTAYGIKFVDIK